MNKIVVATAMLGLTALSTLTGCTVIAVTTTVVGAGVTVASTAVGAVVAVGSGVVSVGSSVIGSNPK
jgi:voltage-gated potassium channel Kch